jgi:thioesterase
MKDIVFNHKVPVQLRFNDADALGHINNSVYFSFYDLGKTEYFKTVRGRHIDTKDIDVVVVHAEVDFLSPVFLSDNIEVQTAVSSIGNKSFTLVQRIVEVPTDTVKCICTTVMVGFDQATHESKPISEEWKRAISEYEHRLFS